MRPPDSKLAQSNRYARPTTYSVSTKDQLYSYLDSLDAFNITMVVSVFIHLVVIVAVNFEPPDLKVLKDKMLHLDVVLVNAKTKTAPTKADAFAQANLDRGGNTDEKKQMKTALPKKQSKAAEARLKPVEEAKADAAQAQKKSEEIRQQKRVAELERKSLELMTQLNSLQKVETQKATLDKKPDESQSKKVSSAKLKSAKDLVAMDMEMERLEAQIAKDREAYQLRPKRKFLGARTKEYRFALYVESWRQKVEKIGTLNFPEKAKELKLYGQLRMTVSIKSDGTIEKIEMNQSSGHRILDNAAKRIVELGAPYAAFPENIRVDTDIISITRTWTFTRQDKLSSQ